MKILLSFSLKKARKIFGKPLAKSCKKGICIVMTTPFTTRKAQNGMKLSAFMQNLLYDVSEDACTLHSTWG